MTAAVAGSRLTFRDLRGHTRRSCSHAHHKRTQSKFTGSFDEVFRSEGVTVIETRSAPRERTRSPSGGSARFGPSGSIGCWSSAAATWSASFGPTAPTSTPKHRGLGLRTLEGLPDPALRPGDRARVPAVLKKELLLG